LSKLKPDKAAGDDNMAPRFLKEVSTVRWGDFSLKGWIRHFSGKFFER